MAIRLSELGSRLQATACWLNEFGGDTKEDARIIDNLAPPNCADRTSLSFLFDPSLASEAGRAGAVIVEPKYSDLIPRPFIVGKPLVALARAWHWLPILGASRACNMDEDRQPAVSNQSFVHRSSTVGPNVVLGQNSTVGANVTVEGEVRIGSFCNIGPNVSIKGPATIGNRVRIDANGTIGGDPFMYVQEQGHWLKVPSFSGVQIEDDVDIGSGTTIDRGLVSDTLIGKGVKLDSQVHIGHGVAIGNDTIIAGRTTVAGEVAIGRECKIGGACVINEGVTLTDNVTLLGMSAVTRSIMQQGEYSSVWPVQLRTQWWKQLAMLKKIAKQHGSHR